MDAGGRKVLVAGILCAAWFLAAPVHAAGTVPPVPDDLRALADTVLARLSEELATSKLGTVGFGVEALVMDPRSGRKPPQALGAIEGRAPPPGVPHPGHKPVPADLRAVARDFVERIGAHYREPAAPLAAEAP